MRSEANVRGSTSTPPFYSARRAGASVAITVSVALAVAVSSGCSKCGDGRAGRERSQPREARSTKGAAIAIAPERAAYVTNNGSDSVSVIDRDGDAVVTVPVDLDPDAREAPHHLAIDSSRGHVFVALAFPPDLRPTKRDPHATHGGSADLGELARLDLRTLAVTESVTVDENPGDVILTHDRTRVLVTHFDMKRAMDVAAKGAASPSTMFAHLVVLDAKTLERVASRALCVAPHGVVTTKDDKTAYVACYGADELAVVDLASEGLPTTRVPLGATPGVPGVPRYGPYSATLTPDETRIVVADLEGRDLKIFDRATKKFVHERTVPLDAKAFMPAFVGAEALIVPLQAPDGIARVDLSAGKVETWAKVDPARCRLPHAARVAKDGRVYVVCEGDHRGPGSVLEIDPTSLDVRRSWEVGVYPDGIAFGDE